MFQTPFGITACESITFEEVSETVPTFQTPFGITACESTEVNIEPFEKTVSNAFRHHCM